MTGVCMTLLMAGNFSPATSGVTYRLLVAFPAVDSTEGIVSAAPSSSFSVMYRIVSSCLLREAVHL